MITVAEQDYVKAIYKLQDLKGEVSTSSLAATLGVTPASVTGMLKKLSKAKMAIYRSHKGVRLTSKGRRSALDVLRRHRLLELFLTDILNMPWESVHQEAEKLEHVVSDEILERIDKLLGSPQRDPHGSPIPSPSGSLLVTKAKRLSEMKLGQKGLVNEVEDKEPIMLQHLRRIGLIPGARIAVEEIQAVDGTIILKCGRRRQVISPKVSSVVWVIEDK